MFFWKDPLMRTLIFLVTVLIATATAGECVNAARFSVTTPPVSVVERLGLGDFYKKHVDLRGFTIVGSEKVSDYALLEAAYLVDKMLGQRQDLLDAMAANKVRLVVMAYNELTTEVPEHSDLKPSKFWDKRARGWGLGRR